MAQLGRLLMLRALRILDCLLLFRLHLTCEKRGAVLFIGRRAALHQSFLILRGPVRVLSEDAARLALITVAAVLLIELLNTIQVEMYLLIAAIVGVLPLVVRSVIRKVDRPHILLQRVLLGVEPLLFVCIFMGS